MRAASVAFIGSARIAARRAARHAPRPPPRGPAPRERRARHALAHASRRERPGVRPRAMPLPIAGPPHEAPAASDFTWFIYGSSLDREAFATWANDHGYAAPDLSRGVRARLDGWRLACDVPSRYWGGAVGTL